MPRQRARRISKWTGLSTLQRRHDDERFPIVNIRSVASPSPSPDGQPFPRRQDYKRDSTAQICQVRAGGESRATVKDFAAACSNRESLHEPREDSDNRSSRLAQVRRSSPCHGRGGAKRIGVLTTRRMSLELLRWLPPVSAALHVAIAPLRKRPPFRRPTSSSAAFEEIRPTAFFKNRIEDSGGIPAANMCSVASVSSTRICRRASAS